VHAQYIQCILEGWNTVASKEYKAALGNALGVDVRGANCQEVMASLATQLFARYGGGKGKYSRHLDRDTRGALYTSAPSIADINKQSWDRFLELRYPAVARAAAKAKSPMKPTDVLKLLGKTRPTE